MSNIRNIGRHVARPTIHLLTTSINAKNKYFSTIIYAMDKNDIYLSIYINSRLQKPGVTGNTNKGNARNMITEYIL